MKDLRKQFDVGDVVRVDVATTSGDITVVPGEPGRVEVELSGSPDGYVVELVGDTVTVQPEKGRRRRFSSTDVVIRAPAGATVVAHCTSGDINVTVPVDDLDLSVASGDIRVREVLGNVKVKSASGDISIDSVEGQTAVTTASGSVKLGRAGSDTVVTTASGDALIDLLEGTAKFQTASGDLHVRRLTGDGLSVKSLSGDVKVGIPPRRRIDFDVQSLSGDLRNELPPGDGSPPEKLVNLRVKSVSGNVTLVGG
jgi:DUF4097 and DUF4098 domain-containing protein YvlB